MSSSWQDFINVARQGNLNDTEFTSVKQAASQPKRTVPAPSLQSQLAAVNKKASILAQSLAADDWFQKLALIDASAIQSGDPSMMQGGGAPMDPSMMQGGGMPMDPAMMQGGGMPMDPSMMQGGGMPMDPSMMQGGGAPMDPSMMQGGAPPVSREEIQQMIQQAVGGTTPQAATAVTGKPAGGKQNPQEVLLSKVLRLTELMNGLYSILGIPLPPSVVDEEELAKAVAQQNGQAPSDGTIPGNPMINQLPAFGTSKIGSEKQQPNSYTAPLPGLAPFSSHPKIGEDLHSAMALQKSRVGAILKALGR